MDQHPGRLNRIAAVVAVIALIAAAGFGWREHRLRRAAEANLPLTTARVLTEAFSGDASLRVARLTGRVASSSNDPGLANLLPSAQQISVGYSVDYFIDLHRLTPASYRWSAATRTMIVRLPDVTASAPNIDEANATVTQSGLFISRGAAQNLARQASARAGGAAMQRARSPEHMEQARAQARVAVSRLIAGPLNAAKLGDVTVVARYPWDGPEGGSRQPRWDESTPLDVILGKDWDAR